MFIGFMLSRFRRTTFLASVSVASIVLVAACQKVPLLAPNGSTISLTSAGNAARTPSTSGIS